MSVPNVLKDDLSDDQARVLCYYQNDDCKGPVVWECQSCGELYCGGHQHHTEQGKNVECVACERERKESEELYEVVVSRSVHEYASLNVRATSRKEAREKGKAEFDNVPESECTTQVVDRRVDLVEKKDGPESCVDRGENEKERNLG